MNDFKFIKGFFTGMLVTDVVIANGFLWLLYKALAQRDERDKNRNRYSKYCSPYTVRKSNRK